MANFPNGLLGNFSGRIGPITAYQRYGKTIGRTAASRVNFKTTPLRATQQQKMKLVTPFTSAFTGTGFFKACFPAYGQAGSGYNRATSLLLNQAVEGSYPDIYLNYARVMISKGKLPPPADAQATLLPNGLLQVQFTNNSQTGTASPADRVVLVAYAETITPAIFSLDAGRRRDGLATLDLRGLQGHSAETWMGFINPDGSNVSDSVYLGRVEV